MVISKKFKYCFIEYPRSASYAIRNELLEFYDGEDWLQKHSRYRDFVKSLPQEYKNYFVFCSIRNPLEDIISVYNINRTNNSSRATPEFWKDHKWYIKMRELRRANFFRNNQDTSFQNFFKKLFILPYIKPRIIAELPYNYFNFIIKVENLQEDFSIVLKKLGIKQVRPVPFYNVSTKNRIDLDVYYPKELRKKTVRILGPIMKFMNYDFPKNWNVTKIPVSSQLYFNIMKPIAACFWNHTDYLKNYNEYFKKHKKENVSIIS